MHEMRVLPNGVRLLIQAVPGVRTAALGFYFDAGSRMELARENGSAHFIEHMSFKGTQKRTAAQLARESDAIGGQMNAYTTKESTCYYVRCLDSHLERAADLLCDMLFCSRFDEADVQLERGVILEEIGMYEDTPEDLVADRLAAAVYKGSPLARPILGRASTLAQMTGESLRQWQKDHYRPEGLVVSLSGSFTPQLVDTLTARLSEMQAGTAKYGKPAAYQSAITVRKKAIEQNHLMLAFPAIAFADRRRYQLVLLSSILGGGVSSRLFQELREKQGLCYTVYSYIADHADTGLFGIYTALGRDMEVRALETICTQLLTLAEHGPTDDEINRVREQAKASVVMGLESVQAKMSHMGTSELLFGKVRSQEEILSEYEQVTKEQLRTLCGEIFDFSRISLSAVGRVDKAEEYAARLARLIGR